MLDDPRSPFRAGTRAAADSYGGSISPGLGGPLPAFCLPVSLCGCWLQGCSCPPSPDCWPLAGPGALAFPSAPSSTPSNSKTISEETEMPPDGCLCFWLSTLRSLQSTGGEGLWPCCPWLVVGGSGAHTELLVLAAQHTCPPVQWCSHPLIEEKCTGTAGGMAGGLHHQAGCAGLNTWVLVQ